MWLFQCCLGNCSVTDIICHQLCRAKWYSGAVKLHFEYKMKSALTTVSGSKSACSFMLTSVWKLHVGVSFTATYAALHESYTFAFVGIPQQGFLILEGATKGFQLTSEQYLAASFHVYTSNFSGRFSSRGPQASG